MPISIDTAQSTLQKYFILCAGVPGDTALAPQLASRVVSDGHWGAVKDVLNGYLSAQADQIGAAALVARMADQAFGVHLSDTQARAYAAPVSSGNMSWADLAGWAVGLGGSLGDTLDNRAEVGRMFSDALNGAHKGGMWSLDGMRGSLQSLLHGVTADSASIEHAIESISKLVDNLGTGGVQGRAADGYIAGATVFVDANGNGTLDAGEYVTWSDGVGNFSIPHDAPAGRVVVQGGVDLLTGAAFHGQLTAPAGSAVVSPLTTLVAALVDRGFVDSAQAGADLVRDALQLPAGVNLLAYDPIAMLAGGQDLDQALAVLKGAVEVMNILGNAGTALQGAMPVSAARAFDAVAGSLAAVLASDGDHGLQSPQVVADILAGAADALGSISKVADLDAALQQVAGMIAAQGAAIAGGDSLYDLSKAAVVALSQLPDALQYGFLIGADLQELAGHFTGSELQGRIASASAGKLLPGMDVHDPDLFTLAFGGTVLGGQHEVQAIELYPHTAGAQYVLTVGGTMLTTAPLGEGASAADVAAALQAAPDYAGAPFVVEAGDGALVLTWKSAGDQNVTAELQSMLVGPALQDGAPQDGVAASSEVQRIPAGELEAGAGYLLTVGGTVLATGMLEGTPTTEQLAGALQSASGYDAAAFTVSASGTDLVLTWKSDGDQSEVAQLQSVTLGAPVSDPAPKDGVGTPEVQTIAPGALIAGAEYQLSVGDTVLVTAALDSDPTADELAGALQASDGYAAAPFTVAADAGGNLVVTWKDIGDQADLAELRSIVIGVPASDPAPQDGTPGVAEVQSIALAGALNPGSVYALTVGGTRLVSGAMDADPTAAELAASLRAATGYANAPFAISAQGTDLVLVWKVAGDQTTIGQLSSLLTSEPVSSTTITDGRGSGNNVEVQSITPSLFAGEAYMMTIGTRSITTAPLDASPTITELASAFQAAPNYSAFPANVAASGSTLQLTWRTGGNQPDGSAQMYHILSTAVATAAATTDGNDGTKEVQAIAADTLTAGARYELEVGGFALLSSPLDADPTAAELVAALSADVAYGSAPFTLSADGSNVIVTWKASGDQAGASLRSVVTSAPLTDPAPVNGAAGTIEVQTLDASTSGLVSGARYLLSVDGTGLMSEPLGQSHTAADLVAALQSAPGYDAMPFTVSTSGGTKMVITWKDVGDQPSAQLSEVIGSGPVLSDSNPQDGVSAVAEVQKIAAPSLTAGAQYTLVVGGTTLVTSALDADPTIGELVGALQAADEYVSAAFTVSASGSDLQVTWKDTGNQTDVAQLQSVLACGQSSGAESQGGQVAESRDSASPLSSPRLMDDMMGGERIHLVSVNNEALAAPVSLTRVADVASSDSLASTIMQVFADLGANEAGLVVVLGGSAAGTYLYADNGNGDVDFGEDVLVELVGAAPGPVGTLAVGDYFA